MFEINKTTNRITLLLITLTLIVFSYSFKLDLTQHDFVFAINLALVFGVTFIPEYKSLTKRILLTIATIVLAASQETLNSTYNLGLDFFRNSKQIYILNEIETLVVYQHVYKLLILLLLAHLTIITLKAKNVKKLKPKRTKKRSA